MADVVYGDWLREVTGKALEGYSRDSNGQWLQDKPVVVAIWGEDAEVDGTNTNSQDCSESKKQESFKAGVIGAGPKQISPSSSKNLEAFQTAVNGARMLSPIDGNSKVCDLESNSNHGEDKKQPAKRKQSGKAVSAQLWVLTKAH